MVIAGPDKENALHISSPEIDWQNKMAIFYFIVVWFIIPIFEYVVQFPNDWLYLKWTMYSKTGHTVYIRKPDDPAFKWSTLGQFWVWLSNGIRHFVFTI
jgi:hypothetical protein